VFLRDIGGDILLESNSGGGARFTIKLPRSTRK